jgi:hypothetical protein
VISILAQPTARTTNHILPLEAHTRVCAYGHVPATSKLSQRHLFNRSAAEASDETRVMDDPPIPYIEAMMEVAAARRDEMRRQGRVFSLFQGPGLHDAYHRASP